MPFYRRYLMTTSTTDLRPATWLFAAGRDAAMPKIEEIDGKWVVNGLKVFRAGTFKDSRGRKKTWRTEDLDAIASNFEALRTDGILIDVPVREDHTDSMNAVKGYFRGVRRNGNFLEADIEFTEPDVAEKYKRSTYRSRSIEIGSYETNGEDPRTFSPCALGLAFVDIGAVEGLFRNSNLEDNEMATDTATFRVRGVPTSDADAVQAYIDSLESATPEVHTFRINGTDETDAAKTQAHIDSLETFRSESMAAGRSAFVDQLLADHKITAPQVEGLKTFAAALDATAFDAWKATYATAPNVFERFAGDGNGSTDNGAGKSEADQAAEDALSTVRMHRLAGMKEERVRETDSYKKYKALTGQDA